MKEVWDLNKYATHTAIKSEDGQSFTYGELAKLVTIFGRSLKTRSLVLNFCKNDVESLVGYISFLNNGVIPIMLKDDMDETITTDFLHKYRPDYIYISTSLKDKFPETEEVYTFQNYSLLKTSFNDSIKFNEELALLLTTSGSTGSPKLVRQSYKNVISNMKSIAEYLKVDSSEVAITSLPFNYTYGLSVVHSHLYAGATIVLSTKTVMQKELWTQLKDYQVTTLAGVPYTYEMLDRLRFTTMDLPHLKTLTQAGGKLSASLHEKYSKWATSTGKKFIVMYGQTEATARMSYLPHESSLKKIGSIGKAIPGGKFKIIDENGKDIEAPDLTGELVYEGDNVALGYADQKEDLAKEDEFKGRLVTGDMAKVDSDGFYYIVGRKKRFLKIFGNRVNLDETERLIKEKFDLTECACAGYDDKMFIFVTQDSLEKEIKTFISKLTELHPTAFQVSLINEVPKNESGKVQYKELEKYYAKL